MNNVVSSLLHSLFYRKGSICIVVTMLYNILILHIEPSQLVIHHDINNQFIRIRNFS
jgi:hypothetical protein